MVQLNFMTTSLSRARERLAALPDRAELVELVFEAAMSSETGICSGTSTQPSFSLNVYRTKEREKK
jgi:hypothetical protein